MAPSTRGGVGVRGQRDSERVGHRSHAQSASRSTRRQSRWTTAYQGLRSWDVLRTGARPRVEPVCLARRVVTYGHPVLPVHAFRDWRNSDRVSRRPKAENRRILRSFRLFLLALRPAGLVFADSFRPPWLGVLGREQVVELY